MNNPPDAIPDKSRLNLRSRSWIAAGVLLAVFVAGLVLLTRLLPGESWDIIRRVGWFYLILLLLLSVLSTALYTAAVCVLIRASGHRTTVVQAYLVLTSSLSVNYITPVKFGIPLRIYLYRQVMQVPLAVGTTLVALETWLGMFIPAGIASVGVAVLFPQIGLAIPLILLAALLAGMMAVLFVKPSLFNPLFLRLPLEKISFRLVRFSETVQTGLRSVSLWRSGVVALLFGLNVSVANTQLYLVLRALGWTVSWPALLAAFTISITAGNLSMIPMGLGVRDASLTLLLAQLGVPKEIAFSAAVIQRFFTPGWPLLLGLISANILGFSSLLRPHSRVERVNHGPAIGTGESDN